VAASQLGVHIHCHARARDVCSVVGDRERRHLAVALNGWRAGRQQAVLPEGFRRSHGSIPARARYKVARDRAAKPVEQPARRRHLSSFKSVFTLAGITPYARCSDAVLRIRHSPRSPDVARRKPARHSFGKHLRHCALEIIGRFRKENKLHIDIVSVSGIDPFIDPICKLLAFANE